MNRFDIFLFLIPLVLYIFPLAKKIDLTTSDLGRHIKNGELVIKSVHDNTILPQDLLRTNYYSYSNADFPTVNHHWLSGVLFYLIHNSFGFAGLSVFFGFLSIGTLALFTLIAKQLSNSKIAFVGAIFFLPLIAERTEIRPECFTYFFCGLLAYLLVSFINNKLPLSWVTIIVFITSVLWMNLHIYFFLSIVIIGAFFLSEIISRGEKVWHFVFLALVSFLGFLINPFGLIGVLYPAKILGSYGYRVVENQSVFFLDKLGFIANINLFYFKIIAFILLSLFIFIVVKRRFAKCYWALLLCFVTSAAGFFAIRNFTLFGLFGLLVFSALFFQIKHLQVRYFLSAIMLSIGVLFLFPKINGEIGIGLKNDNLLSLDFFSLNQIKGPIFNNYDIGGYLIFGLFPKERVYVDNRPESYPPNFLQENYITIQESDDLWEKSLEKFKFNTIFFSYHDATPWGQQFLKSRIEDNSWAPVFVDDYAVIFLRRSLENKELVEKFEIPKSQFVFR